MSVFMSGLEGIQANLRGMLVSAQNLSNVNTEGYRAQRYESGADLMESRPGRGGREEGGDREGASDVDVATEMVALRKYTYGVRANAVVIRTADELEGRLLDVFG